VTTVDAFCEDRGIERLTILHADVEGAEAGPVAAADPASGATPLTVVRSGPDGRPGGRGDLAGLGSVP